MQSHVVGWRFSHVTWYSGYGPRPSKAPEIKLPKIKLRYPGEAQSGEGKLGVSAGGAGLSSPRLTLDPSDMSHQATGTVRPHWEYLTWRIRSPVLGQCTQERQTVQSRHAHVAHRDVGEHGVELRDMVEVTDPQRHRK